MMPDPLMAILECLTGTVNPHRELGTNVFNHAELLSAESKINDGQYLDFCNAAHLIRQGSMVSEESAQEVINLLRSLVNRINVMKSNEATLSKHVETLKNDFKDLQKLNVQIKGNMLKNAVALESAINKKAYKRARTMIKEQKANIIFEFDECDE